MKEIDDHINQMADEGDRLRAIKADPMITRMTQLKEQVRRRNDAARRSAECRATVDQERDLLLARIADTLGISRDQFPAFFNHISDIEDEQET